MPRRFPWLIVVSLVLLVALSGTLLLTLAGIRVLPRGTPLSATVRVLPLELPGTLALDPLEVSKLLEEELAKRAETDVALRLSLGPQNAEKIRDVVIPRLVNSSVIGQLIERIPSLKSVLSLPEIKATARLEIVNHGESALEDVAITLPGLISAETADGGTLEAANVQGRQVLRLGQLAPRNAVSATAWLSAPLENEAEFVGAVALGAAGGLDGEVIVYPRGSWLGDGLATAAWARWAVVAMIAAVGVTALVLLIATLWPVPGRRKSAQLA